MTRTTLNIGMASASPGTRKGSMLRSRSVFFWVGLCSILMIPGCYFGVFGCGTEDVLDYPWGMAAAVSAMRFL